MGSSTRRAKAGAPCRDLALQVDLRPKPRPGAAQAHADAPEGSPSATPFQTRPSRTERRPERRAQPSVPRSARRSPPQNPVISTTPSHPSHLKAHVSRTSDSHSCAVHGAPGIEWLNGSTRGTAPCARIHSPVARCDQVSPSPRTLGENADNAKMKIATTAIARPARRASELSSLSERRRSGSTIDILRSCGKPR